MATGPPFGEKFYRHPARVDPARAVRESSDSLTAVRLPDPVRRAKAQLRPRYRTLTATARSLPDFVIIGTQKAATTSLMRYLREHPDVMVEPGVGEVHFFDNQWQRGALHYRSFFP